jgi:hypothetical protein
MRIPPYLLREEIAHPLATYTATTDSPPQRAHGARGILVVAHVKTVPASQGTMRLQVAGVQPFSNNSSGLVLTGTTFNATGTYVLMIHPGVAKQPSGESAATSHANLYIHAGLLIPDTFVVTFVKSNASAWEVGVAFRRIR